MNIVNSATTQAKRLNKRTAYLLVFHGSRSPQYFSTVLQLGELVRQHLKTLVEVAVLEFAKRSLAEEIVCFCRKAIVLDCQKVKILPVFLSGGVHVREDIPQEIAVAKENLCDGISIELADYVGSFSELTTIIQGKFSQAEGRILLAHGSRLPGGNKHIEQIAHSTKAISAYWTREPSLESAVEMLVKANKTSIAIVPYFLFFGKITQEIASYTTQLRLKYPQQNFYLAQPLGATPELAEAIASIAAKEPAASLD